MEKVADAFLDLVVNEERVGAVVRVTNGGVERHRFWDEGSEGGRGGGK